MSEYIKREDAQDIIDIVLSDYLTDSERAILEDVNAEIGEIPSADVVEVVRCKDCKWCKQNNSHGYEWEECEKINMIGLSHDVVDDDYCSYGERKDGDKE